MIRKISNFFKAFAKKGNDTNEQDIKLDENDSKLLADISKQSDEFAAKLNSALHYVDRNPKNVNTREEYKKSKEYIVKTIKSKSQETRHNDERRKRNRLKKNPSKSGFF